MVKLFLIINVANNRIFLSIIENKQQETIFANFLSHFVDYRSANLRIIIALGMSVCSVIIQAQWGKFVFEVMQSFIFITMFWGLIDPFSIDPDSNHTELPQYGLRQSE